MLETRKDADAEPFSRGGTLVPGQGSAGPAAPRGVGRYVVIKQVGAGAMGVVLAAYDPDLDRKVAVKVLREGRHGGDAAVRMIREAQAMARLSHPNVAQVYEVHRGDGRLFLVMEYVEGVTLRAWLRERRRGWREVLGVYLQAGRGLAAAHAAGLVHRDFKPDNAMIDGAGRVRVLDFGLSRAVVGDAEPGSAGISGVSLVVTAAGTLVGTPAYMSPEQHLRCDADARSDQFSFCVAMWEALYEARPFRGEDLAALAAAVLTGAPAPAPAGSEVPKWLRRVLERGLQREPAARWPTMDALLDALGRDPARSRRRGLVAGLTALVLAGTGYAVASVRAAGAQRCEAAAEELRGVWDAGRREALAAALTATGAPYAGAVLATATGRLDAYAGQWVAAATGACEAHRRGHASAQLLDRRMTCLRRRRAELAATVEVLLQTRAEDVARAADAAGGLPPVADCEDDARLQADGSPVDAAQAAAVEQARGRLARLQALERAGRFAEALAGLGAEQAAADRMGELGLRAEVRLLAGELRGNMMEGPAARAELDEALRLGLEGKADLVAARAMVVRVFVLAYAEGRPSAGLAEAGLAWAMVRRVGSPPELVALLHNNLGTAAEMMGDHVRALDEYERSLALLRVHAPRGSLRWIVVNNFAEALNTAGQAERAMQIVRPVLQELSESYGPCHPIAINMYVILADSRISMARFDEAMVDIARAQACATQQDSQHRITVHLYAAMLHSLREELEQARTHVAKGQGLAVSESEVVPWLDQLELVGAEAELRSGSFDAARLLIENVEERMSATDDAFPVESLRLHLMVSLHALLTGDAQAAASRLKIVEARAGSLRLADRALFAFTLARTLHALGREPGRVRELADAAIRDYGRAGAAYGPRAAEVAAWRDGLPAP